MRTRRRMALLAACAALAALTQGSPALALGAAPAAGAAPAGGGPVFTHFAYSQVSVIGNTNPSALASPTAYTPAPCWVEPRFTGANSYHQGDPQPSATGDADS